MAKPIILWQVRAAGVCLVVTTITACSGLGPARRAAAVAATDPWTWGPIAGAAVITATDSDRRLSDWAKTENPVYGSREAALDASDQFRLYSSTGAWAVFLAARPEGEGGWLREKGMDAGGNLVGLAAARNTTGVLKQAAQRQRPHGGPVRDSFPSAHSTDAFAHASLGRHYSGNLPLASPYQRGADFALGTFAVATAWGRVEGGVHYPTDVLAGAAVANFTTRFFLELAGASSWRVRPRTDDAGGVIIEIEKPL